MITLINSIRKTVDILDGWTIGRLVIDEGVYLQDDKGNLIPVDARAHLEVCNGGRWQPVGGAELSRTTREGWPAYAGMDARVM